MKEMPCASEPVFDAPGTYHDIELSLSRLAQHPLSGFKHILVDGGARVLEANVLRGAVLSKEDTKLQPFERIPPGCISLPHSHDVSKDVKVQWFNL